MRIKGRYVAQIEIDIDCEYKPGQMLPFPEIKERIVGGEVTQNIRELIQDEIDAGSVTVTQQYADLYEVEDGDGD